MLLLKRCLIIFYPRPGLHVKIISKFLQEWALVGTCIDNALSLALE